jgi:hypothetical protein
VQARGERTASASTGVHQALLLLLLNDKTAARSGFAFPRLA